MPLINPSYEDGLFPWTPYHLADPAEVNLEDRATGARLVFDGQKSLRFVQKWQVLHSGAYQRVAVTPGARLTFQASAYLLYGDNPDANQIESLFSKFRVGIDATGGVEPRSDSVRWASTPGQVGWVTARVSEIALAEAVTVFLDGQVGLDWAPDLAVAVFDACALTIFSAPAPAPGADFPVTIRDAGDHYELVARIPKTAP